MNSTVPSPKKSRRSTKKAEVEGGAIAQGKKAKAAGKRGVVVDGAVGGNITTRGITAACAEKVLSSFQRKLESMGAYQCKDNPALTFVAGEVSPHPLQRRNR